MGFLDRLISPRPEDRVDYKNMSYAEMRDDSRAGPILQAAALVFLGSEEGAAWLEQNNLKLAEDKTVVDARGENPRLASIALLSDSSDANAAIQNKLLDEVRSILQNQDE